MKNFKQVILLVLLCSSSFIWADVLTYTTKQHNFGTIEEAKGKVHYKFTYTNTSKQPVVITKVRTSCGCTVPKFDKKPIMPNQKGVIDVTYNPKRRPGRFNKSISVITNKGKDVLTIIGTVNPAPRTLEEDFPIVRNGLRFQLDRFSLSTTVQGKTSTQEFQIANGTSKSIRLNFPNLPKHISIQHPKSIKPKEKVTVKVSYKAGLKKDWGFVTDPISMLVNGNKVPYFVSTRIVDEVVNKETAARVRLSKRFVNLGKKAVGEVVKKTITLENFGQSPLQIRKIKASAPEISCSCPVKVLKPGEKTQLQVTVNVPNKPGSSVYSKVQLVTNDPYSWTTTIRFATRVQK